MAEPTVIDTAHIVCHGVGVTIRCPSVRLSACSMLHHSSGMAWVCCCGPSGREISIDSGGRPAARRSAANASSVKFIANVGG